MLDIEPLRHLLSSVDGERKGRSVGKDDAEGGEGIAQRLLEGGCPAMAAVSKSMKEEEGRWSL